MHRLALSLVVGILVMVGAPTAQPPDQHTDRDRAPFLDDYVGQYELTPTFILNVMRVGDALYVQGPRQSASQMRARSTTEFVLVGSRLRIVFGIDPISGDVDHLIFEQDGVGRRAERLGRTVAVAADTSEPEPEIAEIDPGSLQRYLGTYEEQPGFAITISLRDGRLSAAMEGQSARAILPESETEFYYEDSPARLSFQLGTGGMVDRVILHEGGSDIPMDRVVR